MRTSQYLLSTLKETPSDAEVISHQLMLRAGMIRKLASGMYAWLPTGLRVLKKIENIVREEMNNAGAIEVSMPVVQPAELWQESGRWDDYGPELCRLTDRHNRPFVLGPTHEEVITSLIRYEVNSYKQLPLNLYQIQTKFRDEVRPRFGVMRGREFLMKDAYSFHIDKASLIETYERMHAAYCAAFTRMGLNFRPVQADTGSIGGTGSHEFHVLAESGEDDIAFSDSSDYAANIEKAEAIPREKERGAATEELRLVDTPNAKTIAQLVEGFNLPIEKTIKTLVVHAEEKGKLIALIIRGDHELNEIKAANQPGVASPLVMASETELRDAIGAGAGGTTVATTSFSTRWANSPARACNSTSAASMLRSFSAAAICEEACSCKAINMRYSRRRMSRCASLAPAAVSNSVASRKEGSPTASLPDKSSRSGIRPEPAR